jgi:hypothetical protein
MHVHAVARPRVTVFVWSLLLLSYVRLRRSCEEQQAPYEEARGEEHAHDFHGVRSGVEGLQDV